MDIPGFQIKGLVAKGGSSSVFQAVQRSLGRTVALKILKPVHRQVDAARFFDEGRIIAALNHRNIITIYDIGAIKSWYYIAMEFLDGGSLQERIGSQMPAEEALGLVEAIGESLDFVHRQGVVHRDIKPANILFHGDGTPKLTDFGIAKQLSTDQELTLDGRALGSPYYLSPEQAQSRALDGRSDIYSLGIVLYEMLTGERPFEGESHIETIIAHLTEPVPHLPSKYSALQPLLNRMIAKAPADRFKTAAEMVEEVRRVRRQYESEKRSPVRDAITDGLAALASLHKTQSPRRLAGLGAFAFAVLVGLVGVFSIVLSDFRPGGEQASVPPQSALAATAPGNTVRSEPESPQTAESLSVPSSEPAANTAVSAADEAPNLMGPPVGSVAVDTEPAPEAEVAETAALLHEPEAPPVADAMGPSTAPPDVAPDVTSALTASAPLPAQVDSDSSAAQAVVGQTATEDSAMAVSEPLQDPGGVEDVAEASAFASERADPVSVTATAPDGYGPRVDADPVSLSAPASADENRPETSVMAEDSLDAQGADETPLAAATSEESADEPSDATDSEQIQEWLGLADAAIARYRLTIPRQDNAIYYYRKVLEVDPGNADATRGLRRVSDAYAELTRSAISKSSPSKARSYVNRGLGITPGHRELTRLDSELKLLEAPPETAKEDPVKRFFKRVGSFLSGGQDGKASENTDTESDNR